MTQFSTAKRLLFAYLIGLAACFISFSIANRPGIGYVNTVFAVTLGLSSWMAEIAGSRTIAIYIALAAGLLALLFVAAEALRVRDSWFRWLGYVLWAILVAASFLWFKPPNI